MIWDVLLVVFWVVVGFFVVFCAFGVWLFYQAGKTFDHKAQRRAYPAGESSYNPVSTEASFNLPPTRKQRLRGSLARVRDWIYAQKFRFERGSQFLAFVQFALLVFVAADKLKVIGLPRWAVYGLIPLGFLGMWAFGWFVVEKVRGFQKDETEALKRSPAWEKHRENFERVEEILQIVKSLNLASGGSRAGGIGVEVQVGGELSPLQEPVNEKP